MTLSPIAENRAMRMSLYLTLGSLAHKLQTVQIKEVKKLEKENVLLMVSINIFVSNYFVLLSFSITYHVHNNNERFLKYLTKTHKLQCHFF